MDYRIYLAGPISGLNWDNATNWRKYLIEKFIDAGNKNRNYMALSPLRGKEYLSEEKSLGDQYTQHIMSTQKVITRRDLYDIKRSDIILVNLLNTNSVSIGTVLEIGVAASLNIPIVCIMEDDNIHSHSMIRESSVVILDNLDEAYDFIINFLG